MLVLATRLGVLMLIALVPALAFANEPPQGEAVAVAESGTAEVAAPDLQGTEISNGGSWFNGPAAISFGGEEDGLFKRGVVVELASIAEVFSNQSGGLSTRDANDHRGLVDLVIELDLEELGLWSGGTVLFDLQSGHGSGVSERYVGDLQTVSGIDAGDLEQVAELWLQQSVVADKLWLKVGKQDANGDFAVVDYGGDFVHSSVGLIPTVPMPTYPDPGLGLAVFAEPNEHVGVSAGVYDGAAVGNQSGFSTLFDGEGGLFSIMEIELNPFGSDADGQRAFRVGGWYHSGELEGVGVHESDVYKENYGFYGTCDVTLMSEEPGSDQGLGMFLQVGVAPDERNEISQYLGPSVPTSMRHRPPCELV